jgi:type I restriction enzyme, S subunit
MNTDRASTITNSQLKEGYKQTEIGVIPEDWIIKSLGTITDPQRPISYGIVQTGSQVLNGVPCLRVVDINNGKINRSDFITTSQEISNSYKRTILKTGDLVMPLRGKVGDTAIIDKELSGANLTRGLALIALEKEWSNYYLHQNISFSKSKARLAQSLNGSALQELPIATLRAFKVAFPPTKAEQEAIACTLSDIDALIESLDRLLTKKRQIKQGAMQELLTAKKRLATFNNKWEEKYLGDIAEIIMGQSPKSFCYNTKGQGLPLIQGNADILNRQTIKRIFTTEVTKRGKYGDIIMSVRAPVGEIARAVFDSCLGRGVCSIRYDNDFLYHYLIWRESDWVGLSKGSTFDSVNSADIRSFKLFIPNEPQEQIEIANILSDMDAEIDAISAKLTKTRQLKQGMMHELLTGRIRLVGNTSIS